MSNDKHSFSKKEILIISGVILSILLVLFTVDQLRMKYASGRVDKHLFFDTSKGPVLVLLEWIGAGKNSSGASVGSGRISTISLDSGQLIYRGDLDYRSYLGRTKDYFWGFTREEVAAIDPMTGAPLQTLESITEKNPPLRRGISQISVETEGSLVVQTRDSELYRIHPETFAASSVSENEWFRLHLWPIHSLSSASTASPTDKEVSSSGFYNFQGDAKKALSKKVDDNPFSDPSQTKPLPGSDTFIVPTFIRDTMEDKALKLPDPGGFLVAHRESFDEGAPLLISRVSLDGKILWTYAQKQESAQEVMAARILKDAVIIALSKYAVALSLADGKVLWQYEY